MDDIEFLNQLRKEFLESVSFELPNCEELLMDYEKNQDFEALVKLMRILHSLKGSAQAVEMTEFSQALHAFESTCVLQKDKLIPATSFVSQQLKQLDKIKTDTLTALAKVAA